MGLFSGLFGSKDKETTTTVDPWANMPEWMSEALESDAAFRQELLGEGEAIAEDLAADPREILGLSGGELAGMDTIMAGAENADYLADLAIGGLSGLGVDDSNLDYRDETDRYMQELDAYERADTNYESDYTDDVVDTTLAGMERQSERERLARQGQSAAVGGTSNTRAAVGDAVAEQLTGMNMAEVEASLRDAAFRFGSEMDLRDEAMGMDQERLMLNKAGQAFGYGESDRNFGLDLSALMSTYSDKELSRAMTEGGALGMLGETERNLEQAGLDEARTSDQQAHSWLSNLFSGTNMNYGPVGGETTSVQPAPSTFSQILGAGASIAGGMLAASDERIKTDIKPSSSGLDVLRDVTPSTYRYKNGYGHRTDEHTGLIAQDLEGIKGAVIRDDDGVRYVDPYPVLATVVQAVKELDERTS